MTKNPVRAYIATHNPNRYDDVPYEIYNPLSRKYAYGLIVLVDGRPSNIAKSWVTSKEALLPQIVAVNHLLNAIEEFDDLPELQIIARSGHLLRRIGMVEDRLQKKQAGRHVDPIQNEEMWEETTKRLQRYQYGIRAAVTEEEASQLLLIKDDLKDAFYRSKIFSSPTPPEPELVLADG